MQNTALLAVIAVLVVTIQAQELQPIDNAADNCRNAEEIVADCVVLFKQMVSDNITADCQNGIPREFLLCIAPVQDCVNMESILEDAYTNAYSQNDPRRFFRIRIRIDIRIRIRIRIGRDTENGGNVDGSGCYVVTLNECGYGCCPFTQKPLLADGAEKCISVFGKDDRQLLSGASTFQPALAALAMVPLAISAAFFH